MYSVFYQLNNCLEWTIGGRAYDFWAKPWSPTSHLWVFPDRNKARNSEKEEAWSVRICNLSALNGHLTQFQNHCAFFPSHQGNKVSGESFRHAWPQTSLPSTWCMKSKQCCKLPSSHHGSLEPSQSWKISPALSSSASFAGSFEKTLTFTNYFTLGLLPSTFHLTPHIDRPPILETRHRFRSLYFTYGQLRPPVNSCVQSSKFCVISSQASWLSASSVLIFQHGDQSENEDVDNAWWATHAIVTLCLIWTETHHKQQRTTLKWWTS